MSRENCQWYLERALTFYHEGDKHMSRVFFQSLMNMLIDGVYPPKATKKKRRSKHANKRR